MKATPAKGCPVCRTPLIAIQKKRGPGCIVTGFAAVMMIAGIWDMVAGLFGGIITGGVMMGVGLLALIAQVMLRGSETVMHCPLCKKDR